MKKFLATALAVSVLASMSVPVFADTEVTPVSNDVVLNEEVKNTAPSFIEKSVKSISEEKLVITDGKEDTEIDTEGLLVFSIKGDILKVSDINEKDNIRFYEANSTVIILDGDDEKPTNCVIDEFKKSETLGDYVDSNNNLAINASDNMEIVDFEGNKHSIKDIEGNYIAVFYDMMTMSIPAITNPTKVIILGGVPAVLPANTDEETTAPTAAPEASPEATIAPAETNVVLDKYDLDKSLVKTVDGINLVPLRKIAEDLDYEVIWNGNNKSVQVGTIQMGVYLQIGENSYTKSRMTPAVLSAAPVIIDDRTYVPVDFFEEILETVINISE